VEKILSSLIKKSSRGKAQSSLVIIANSTQEVLVVKGGITRTFQKKLSYPLQKNMRGDQSINKNQISLAKDCLAT
jgi:hypothetical protein